MKIVRIAFVLVLLAYLAPAHAADAQDRNDLSGYLISHGAIVMPYTLDSNRQMNAEAVLCSCEQRCSGVSLQYDLGDPDNNINDELKEKLSLTGNEKTLNKLYLGPLAPLSNLPISFKNRKGQGSYIGARWMEKLALWFNFGAQEVYGNVPSGVFEGYMKKSELHYRTIPLKTFDAYRYLTVSINGKKPVSFLIDTGAPRSLIDKNYAESLGFGVSEKQCLGVSSQAGETRSCVTHDVMSLKAENEPLSVYLPAGFIELDLNFVVPRLHIKGILGLDWLERNAAIMSLPENRLYVPNMY
ncbi:hypothetical protein PHO31112_03238 [Pandoraea horticolens]|uniref:Aspartyl protease n=1 Tax=Pandoraea horticolens TaxID=2508298 RepID=A0A5E4WJG3_9BURK|nr:retropepsin-like aspartic protease [Pandoraea horticolens]VVE23135.1 hypothetical protein PHO31112_03238 [Pandoraea horticolens]